MWFIFLCNFESRCCYTLQTSVFMKYFNLCGRFFGLKVRDSTFNSLFNQWKWIWLFLISISWSRISDNQAVMLLSYSEWQFLKSFLGYQTKVVFVSRLLLFRAHPKANSRAAPSEEAHHRPNTGRNSEGRQIKKCICWLPYKICNRVYFMTTKIPRLTNCCLCCFYTITNELT